MRVFDFSNELSLMSRSLGYTKSDLKIGIYIPTRRYNLNIEPLFYESGTKVTLPIKDGLNIENASGDVIVYGHETDSVSYTPQYPITAAKVLEECIRLSQLYRATNRKLFEVNPALPEMGPLLMCTSRSGNLHDDILDTFILHYGTNIGLEHINLVTSILKKISMIPDNVYNVTYDGPFLTVNHIGETKSLRYDEILRDIR